MATNHEVGSSNLSGRAKFAFLFNDLIWIRGRRIAAP